MAPRGLWMALAAAALLAAGAPGASAASCAAEPDDEGAARAALVSMLQRPGGNASLELGRATQERGAPERLAAAPRPGLAAWLQSRAEAEAGQSRTQTDIGSLLIGVLFGLGLAFFLLLIHNNFNWTTTLAETKEIFDDGQEWAEEQRKAYAADREQNQGKVCC